MRPPKEPPDDRSKQVAGVKLTALYLTRLSESCLRAFVPRVSGLHTNTANEAYEPDFNCCLKHPTTAGKRD